MAINEINTKEQKKAERASRTLKEKYKYICKKFLFASSVSLLLFFVFASIFSIIAEYDYLVSREQLLFVSAMVIASSIILAVLITPTVIFAYKYMQECKKEEKKEHERKESLINQLNKKEFKEIKLEKTENRFFNAFLGNTIKAKIHQDNDEIVILSFCFVDDLDKACWKSVPFSKDYLLETIDDVIDINTK